MKYKVGDKVRIRKDLKAGKTYGKKILMSAMEKYLGCEATIKAYREESGYYVLDKDAADGHWGWSEEMLEPATDCDFKVGDKVIFNPNEKNKLLGVFTISDIDTDLGTPYIKLEGFNMWFKPDTFLKVPLFKEGDIVTFKDIEKDKWFASGPMSEIEDCYGVIEKVKENYYEADKQGQDGCEYTVRDTKTDSIWLVTSASMELVPTIADIGTVDYYLKEDIIAGTTTAEAIAQAVDNVKSPQFKVGDRVLIREDLIPGKVYSEWGNWIFQYEMAQYKGKIATIVAFRNCDSHYCSLDIDKKRWSWITNSLLPYTPGSDYDLDKKILINKQQTKQNYENRLQESDPVISGGKERSGCAVCYPGSKTSIGIGHLRDSTTACKC